MLLEGLGIMVVRVVCLCRGEFARHVSSGTNACLVCILVGDSSGKAGGKAAAAVCVYVVAAVASQGASYLTSAAVTAAHARELAAAGGIITAQDLTGAQPLERQLLTVQVSKHM